MKLAEENPELMGMASNEEMVSNEVIDPAVAGEEAVEEEASEEVTEEGVEAVVGTQAAPGLPELGSKMSYIVQKGDSLVKIATRIYGNPTNGQKLRALQVWLIPN